MGPVAPGGTVAPWYIEVVADGARSYTDDEVEAIFRRALERQQAAGEGLGREELVAAAKEMGLDEAALDHAAREVERERSEEELRLAVQRKKREKWLRHLVTYLVIAGGLLGMHVLGLVGAWVIWVAFGWGAGLALDTFGTLRGPTEKEIDKERRRRDRRARQAAKARAREERRRQRAEAKRRAASSPRKSEVGDELERVIEEGVGLLLGVAAKKLREATEQLERGEKPQGEFGRYVARRQAEQRGETPRSGAEVPGRKRPDQVRVRVADEDEMEEEAEVEAAARRRRRAKR
jgi:hypothetical protein